MNELKYVIVVGKNITPDNYDMWARAIVFNGMITHKSVVDRENFKVIGAGFCVVQPEAFDFKVKVYGKSVSLEIESNPQFDSEVIKTTLTRNHKYI